MPLPTTPYVGPGTYNEEVDVTFPVSIIGAGSHSTIVDATNLAHGFFVDGYDNPGLNDVTIAGFTVRYALYEGILVVSASDVTLRDNKVENNDQIPGIQFTGDPTVVPNQPGNGIYETDETGDCGGGIHLVGTANSIVSRNFVIGNSDGILISDETAESHDNLVTHNIFKDNPAECGIVMASHPPAGHTSPPFAPHYGVDRNTISYNLSDHKWRQRGRRRIGFVHRWRGPRSCFGQCDHREYSDEQWAGRRRTAHPCGSGFRTARR